MCTCCVRAIGIPRVPYAAGNFLGRVIDSLATVVRMEPNNPSLGGEEIHLHLHSLRNEKLLTPLSLGHLINKAWTRVAGN